MSLLEILLSIYFAFYFFIFILLLILWKVSKPLSFSNKYFPKVSILIAARNEQENIIDCLRSIELIDYPKNLFEVLIGNDQSTDSTEALIVRFIEDKSNFKLFNITTEIGKAMGKANVLAQLAKEASGEYLFFTDADVEVKASWIKGLLSECSSDVGIVSGITLVEGESYFERFQMMDMAFAFGMVKVVSDLNIPVTAIGNNMMVSAKAYHSTGGYEKIPFSVTEDFQLFKEVINRNWNFKNLVTVEVLSFSKAIKSITALLNQRRRWMHGAVKLPLVLIFILSIQSIFLPIILLTIYLFPLLGLLLWIGKIILQKIFISKILNAVNHHINLIKFIFWYELYAGTLSFILLFYYLISGKINWKDRKF